jgi:hypothetical protein
MQKPLPSSVQTSVKSSAPPKHSLLVAQASPQDHVDCFCIEVPFEVGLEGFVASFYTTWLFKKERFVLGLAGYRSTDALAMALAQGQLDAFAAWKLESRCDGQILMRDVTGTTCSWLMVMPLEAGTRLYFGSGLRMPAHRAPGRSGMPVRFRALMGLHLLYSRALLAAAAQRLSRANNQPKISA